MSTINIDSLSVNDPEHLKRHSVKSHVINYWSQLADDIAELQSLELQSEKNGQWLREIMPYMPEGRGLRVLDAGTGTGFLALLLAQQGHMVSGIDITPRMIRAAKKSAERLGLRVDFQVMDAENTSFEPETFDVIVARNVTWTLPHLDQAYSHWYRLLKPGGTLINFDGDYIHDFSHSEQGLSMNQGDLSLEGGLVEEYGHIMDHLAGEQPDRPAWDLQLLYNAGFRDISLDETVSDRVYASADKFYNPTRMFTITAER